MISDPQTGVSRRRDDGAILRVTRVTDDVICLYDGFYHSVISVLASSTVPHTRATNNAAAFYYARELPIRNSILFAICDNTALLDDLLTFCSLSAVKFVVQSDVL